MMRPPVGFSWSSEAGLHRFARGIPDWRATDEQAGALAILGRLVDQQGDKVMAECVARTASRVAALALPGDRPRRPAPIITGMW